MKQINKMMSMLVLLWLSISFASFAQKFHVIDVDKGTHSVPIGNYFNGAWGAFQKFEFTVLNGIAYFAADDGIHGRELWRSDGTEAGTKLVKDVNPGFASSNPISIKASGSKIFFAADDGVHGIELWISDGTPAGTKLLKDIYPGVVSSTPVFLTDVNGTLYFLIDYSLGTDQLWKSDGTKEGTVRVANFYTSKFGFSSGAWQLVNVNEKLFFVLNNQLYTSDGTSDGTMLVKDGFVNAPLNLTSFKGMLYFISDDGSGPQLWVSDGTDAGTHLVNNSNNIYLYGDAFNNGLNKFVTKGNKLFFPGYSPDNDGSELCSYDVSDPSNNVEIVKDFVPGQPSHNLYNLVNVDGTIYFTVYPGTNSDQSLWKSDGTTKGTVMVKDINPGGHNIYWYKEFKDHNGKLLFSFYDDAYGTEPWISDGTEKGTMMIKDISPGIYGSAFEANTTYIGNNVSLFQATDRKTGLELWRTDGTEAGTYLVKDIDQSSTYSSDPAWLTPTTDNSKLIFEAGTWKYNNEIWFTDGTDAHLLKDIVPGSTFGSYPFFLASIKKSTYFFASVVVPSQNSSDVFTELRLFKTDGTTAGTKIINAPALQNTISYNGYVAQVLSASDLYYILVFNFNTYQYELWRTDGTEAGTFALKTDIDGNYWPQPTAVGNTLFFTNNNATYGDELWSTNGTVAGTKMVKDINTGFNSSYPYNLFAFNGKLYFDATDVNFQTYIWSSDGTKSGTKPVKKTTIADWWVSGANNELLFAATDPYHGEELWGTDGTSAGTKLIKDILSGPDGSAPGTGVSTGSLVYFTATTYSYGSELWKSDGTREGTKLVKDIVSGPDWSFLDDLVTANGKLYFINNSDSGSLWSSDGTANGTARVNDAGLTDVSGLAQLTPAGDKLYFTAFANATGNELYVGDISANVTSSPVADNLQLKQNADHIYPNPAKNILYVQTNGTAMFSLINQSGKQMLEQIISNSGAINVASLSAGVYYLKNNTTGQTQKIVIAK